MNSIDTLTLGLLTIVGFMIIISVVAFIEAQDVKTIEEDEYW